MNRLLVAKRVPVTCLVYGEWLIKEKNLFRHLSFKDKSVVAEFYKNTHLPTDLVGLHDRLVPSGYVINNETGQLYVVHSVNCQNVASNSSDLVPNGVYHADIYRDNRLWHAFNLTDPLDNSREEFFVKRPMHAHNTNDELLKVGATGKLIGIYEHMFLFEVKEFSEPIGRATDISNYRICYISTSFSL